jgi:predicted transporter
MNMDLNIILWIGGMLFSLSIFAVKVGFGLGFGGMRWKGIAITLSLYIVLFVLFAVLSGQLMKMLEPMLKKGAYLHALMAIGMIVWGIILLRTQSTDHRAQTKLKFKIQNSKINNSELSTLNSLLLLIPCPVCLTAMTFSTWAALNVFKFPAYLVGIGHGIVFIVLSLAFYFSLRFFTRHSSLVTPKVGLSLSMIAIGVYFIASLYLPAKIEEAKGIYQSFLTEGNSIDMNNSIGVLAILFVSVVIGWFANKKSEVQK